MLLSWLALAGMAAGPGSPPENSGAIFLPAPGAAVYADDLLQSAIAGLLVSAWVVGVSGFPHLHTMADERLGIIAVEDLATTLELEAELDSHGARIFGQAGKAVENPLEIHFRDPLAAIHSGELCPDKLPLKDPALLDDLAQRRGQLKRPDKPAMDDYD